MSKKVTVYYSNYWGTGFALEKRGKSYSATINTGKERIKLTFSNVALKNFLKAFDVEKIGSL